MASRGLAWFTVGEVGSGPPASSKSPRTVRPPSSAQLIGIFEPPLKFRVHDFQSTNGTFVNCRQIMGNIEIRNEDQLTVGPLSFAVRVHSRPGPLPRRALTGQESPRYPLR